VHLTVQLAETTQLQTSLNKHQSSLKGGASKNKKKAVVFLNEHSSDMPKLTLSFSIRKKLPDNSVSPEYFARS
jgi:hypothetical protein